MKWYSFIRTKLDGMRPGKEMPTGFELDPDRLKEVDQCH